MIKEKLRPYINRLKYELKLDPIVLKKENWRDFIPEPYKTVLLISADFELAWAWRFTKSSQKPLEKAIKKAKVERENIKSILDICNLYNIPITWATVGHLFLNKCESISGIPHSHLIRPKNFENKFWNFQTGDWFKHDPCTDYLSAPEWYAPDLIKLILDSPIEHEIGNHTFSHIDCRENVCPPELLSAELKESKNLAKKIGLELKSFVHPAHTIGNLDVLYNEGFTNFRTDYRNVLGFPVKHTSGLWELEQTSEFRFYDYWSREFQVKRYIRMIKQSMKYNNVCVFWFHPSFDSRVISDIWPSVFQFINDNREHVLVTTHSDYVNWLDEKKKE